MPFLDKDGLQHFFSGIKDRFLRVDDQALTGEAPAVNAGTFGGMTVAQFVDMIYPVGSIYLSASAASPSSLFGGTWESIGGRFLLGADAAYAAGSTGGEETHTLTVEEMPSHAHTIRRPQWFGVEKEVVDSSSNAIFGQKTTTTPCYRGTEIDTAGGGAAHNNMPPYLSVYMWKRTA